MRPLVKSIQATVCPRSPVTSFGIDLMSDVVVKLLEFALPRLKGIEATIETEQDKSRIELGLLTRNERKVWYGLYDKACGKSNGQTDDVDQVKNQDNG